MNRKSILENINFYLGDSHVKVGGNHVPSKGRKRSEAGKRRSI